VVPGDGDGDDQAEASVATKVKTSIVLNNNINILSCSQALIFFGDHMPSVQNTSILLRISRFQAKSDEERILYWISRIAEEGIRQSTDTSGSPPKTSS
jgi:hypothetical protein